MGREYFGSIEGKCWVAVGSSRELEHLLDLACDSHCLPDAPCPNCAAFDTLTPVCENVKYTVGREQRTALETALAEIRQQLPQRVRELYDGYSGSWQYAHQVPHPEAEDQGELAFRYQFGRQVLWSLQQFGVCHVECET